MHLSPESPSERIERLHVPVPFRAFRARTLYGTERGVQNDHVVVVGPDGRIVHVGGPQDARDFLATIRAQGASVEERETEVLLPAFTDAHNHPLAFSALNAQGPAFTFGVTDFDLLRGSIASQLEGRTGPQVALGWDTALMGKLSKVDLDLARKEPTFLFDISFHGAVANSAGLEALEHYLEKNGLRHGKDIRGEIHENGQLFEDYALFAMEVLEESMDQERATASTVAYLEEMRRGGTLFTHEMAITTPSQLDIFLALPPEARSMIRIAHLTPRTVRVAEARGIDVSGFDLKLIVDGSNQSHSALHYKPYADTHSHGTQNLTLTQARNELEHAAKLGIRNVAVHAIGDHGIDVALGITHLWQTVTREHGLDGAARIEHMSSPTIEALRKAGDAGLSVSPQPNFIPDIIPFADRFDEEQLRRMVPLQLMRELGINTMIGTDGMPNSMAIALNCATQAPESSQRLTVEDAFRAASETAPRYEGDNRGQIRVGAPGHFLLAKQSFVDAISSDLGVYGASPTDLHSTLIEQGNAIAAMLDATVLDGTVRLTHEEGTDGTP